MIHFYIESSGLNFYLFKKLDLGFGAPGWLCWLNVQVLISALFVRLRTKSGSVLRSMSLGLLEDSLPLPLPIQINKILKKKKKQFLVLVL